MLTVTQLGRQAGMSRSTLLYYEREGLLKPALRSESGYRYYGDIEQNRLKSIVAYRAYGLAVSDIHQLLELNDRQAQAQLLKQHFQQLEQEIGQLRQQQKGIVALLQEPELLEENNVTKERWVAIMQAAGFDEDAMTRWHQTFEQMEPEEHQKFLESLGIGEEEIQRIRAF